MRLASLEHAFVLEAAKSFGAMQARRPPNEAAGWSPVEEAFPLPSCTDQLDADALPDAARRSRLLLKPLRLGFNPPSEGGCHLQLGRTFLGRLDRGTGRKSGLGS